MSTRAVPSFAELMDLLRPSDVLSAARAIDRMEIPTTRQGTYYEALVEGRAYPPKLLLENAVRVLSRRNPRVPKGWGQRGSGFNGGPQTNQPLTRLGFEVRDRRLARGDEAEVQRFAQELGSEATEPEFVWRSIALRRGQPAFRNALLRQYDERCSFSGWDVVSSLEAAHIVPYAECANSKVTNGLLLRGDLHTLFDLHLITVEPDRRIILVAPALRESRVAELHERPLASPRTPSASPTREALAHHHALAIVKPSWS